ncbi:MAG: hypothetical protein ACR2ND_08160 [Solirubrobacteraceae bacterium]
MILALLALLALLAGVIWLVSGPLRSGPRSAEAQSGSDRAALEAAKAAKYAEIRDAEMDLQMGKLSEQDFHALNMQLRAEAVEILRALEAQG